MSKKQILWKYVLRYLEYIQAALLGFISAMAVMFTLHPAFTALVIACTGGFMIQFSGYIKDRYGIQNGLVKDSTTSK